MPVITMSGNLAGGAREVGGAVSRLLDIGFVDQALMVQAAKRCGVPIGTLAKHDERYGSLRERVSQLLQTFLERSAASGGADPLTGATGLEAVLSRTYADMAADRVEPHLSDSTYVETMTAVIEEIASEGDTVILGRASQIILKDWPKAVNVLCVAPQELRFRRLSERDSIGLEEATKRVHESDRARGAFYRKFWKVELEDPNLYDISINTWHVDYEAAAELVAATVRLKASN
ncbi:MAG: cytidylate kinase-like family protein [Chloroflexi bacterium]|nr:cytidylate kinase-like family protein [Chloroflexota bacterium]